MDKDWREDWREFEKLVTRIERVLAPTGAAVKWNDRIKDNITGDLRQVDVSIRYTHNNTPILITVECRKRKDKSDVTWIEQLVTKRGDLDAAYTIAVASKDITKPAKEKAIYYGIEFRLVSEISQDDMLGWLKIKQVKHLIYIREIRQVNNFKMYSEEEAGTLHPLVIKKVKADRNAKVFIRHSDGKPFNIEEILIASIRKGLDIFTGVPLDGSKVRKHAVINFPKGMMHILTDKGPRDLAQLTIGVDLYTAVKIVPASDIGFSYSGANIPTSHGVEARTELFGNLVNVSFHKQEGSEDLIVQITKEKIEDNGNK